VTKNNNSVLEDAVARMMSGVNPIRRLRKALDLTAQQLAESSHLSEQTIWKMETGASEPKTSTIYQLAGALGVDPTVLIGCCKDWDDARRGASAETLMRTVSADPDIYLRRFNANN